MAEIHKINRQEAKLSPDSRFETPQQVTAETGLTRAEKLTVLRNWASDVRRRLDAADEGMAPAPDPAQRDRAKSVTSDAELLRTIELEMMGLEPKDAQGSTTR